MEGAALRGADHDLKAFDGFFLAGEIGKRERPQRCLHGRDGRGEGGGDVAEAGRRRLSDFAAETTSRRFVEVLAEVAGAGRVVA